MSKKLEESLPDYQRVVDWLGEETPIERADRLADVALQRHNVRRTRREHIKRILMDALEMQYYTLKGEKIRHDWQSRTDSKTEE